MAVLFCACERESSSTVLTPSAPGTLNGKFSISATEQVRFSRGNLQYQASTGTWRFAEHQWDYIGSDNWQISETYSGWIDLFGWGTSGWNSGAKAYQPWSTSTTYSDYYPGGSASNNLTGSYAKADWGVYNQIGGDAPGMWRTLTKDEWVYLFHGRTNYAQLFGLGTVNGVSGTIILPDDWVLPAGLTFSPSTSKGLSWRNTYYYNSGYNNFFHNTYTSAQWEKMEAAGAVFLPCAGSRDGTLVYYVGTNGGYCSATRCGTGYAYILYFGSDFLYPQYDDNRNSGCSVRLVAVFEN
ncbi:MAG: hypothetical protein IJT35_04390 [Paludibacteraceae bacterium]|nr:hypothetical protein [Paludibacteraceae bacterium]